MADDTRPIKEDLSKEALTVQPLNRPFSGKQWQEPLTKAPENANMLAGGTQNTAGGKMPEVTLGNAVTSIKLEDFKDLAKKPCTRDSFLTGIGAGFGVGGLRAVVGGSIWAGCNWAVASFVFGCIAQYQYCQHRRQAEKEGMLRAVEVLSKKEVERKAREAHREQMKAERRKAKEEEQDAQFASLKDAEGKKSSWKWW